MTYVQSHLMPGERIVYPAHRHHIAYAGGVVFALIALAFMIAGLRPAAVVALGVAVVLAIPAYVKVKTSEFAVTDQRVVIKVGWLKRRSLETLLDKIEGIAVEQGLTGRMLGYGTIVVSGTGGTHERFTMIADPLEFRKQVQIATAGRTTPSIRVASVEREERECPYCAERILAKARVCKYCGRDVAPVSA